MSSGPGSKRGAEQEDALALASHLMGGNKEKAVAAPVGSGKNDNEKKLKSLRKVIIYLALSNFYQCTT